MFAEVLYCRLYHPSVQTVEGDVSVGAAVDQLHAAVADLVDPIKALVHGTVRVAPSWYDQLVAEVAVSSGRDKIRRSHAGWRSIVWLDAMLLADEIDTAVAAWQPQGGGTPDRLRLLASRRWRPQDVKGIEQITEAVKAWRLSVVGLLEPERVKTISAPCPACGSRWVYRRQDGETVRQPALQLVAEKGCVCQSCRTSWAPELYLHLCRLLGFDLPAGVLA